MYRVHSLQNTKFLDLINVNSDLILSTITFMSSDEYISSQDIAINVLDCFTIPRVLPEMLYSPSFLPLKSFRIFVKTLRKLDA